jgi:hypothetical protein
MVHMRILSSVVAVSAALLLTPAAFAQAFSCPATATVTEQAQGPQGWAAGPAVKAEHALQTAKIYNGNPGKEEYDLAPDDDVKQGKNALLSWIVKDYRQMNVFVRCFYFDTKATITANIPPAITKCSVKLEMTANGTIVGKTQMTCQ